MHPNNFGVMFCIKLYFIIIILFFGRAGGSLRIKPALPLTPLEYCYAIDV